MNVRLPSLFVALPVSLLLVLGSPAHSAVTVTPMSFIPETIAGGGSAVFGVSGADVKRWTPATGATTVVQFPAGSAFRHVTDASDDGSVLVGRFSPTGSAVTNNPWYWTAATGFQTINTPITPAARVFVSGDGQRIVGDTFSFTRPSTLGTNLDNPRAIDFDGSHVGLGGTAGVARMRVNGVVQTFQIPGDTTSTRVTGFTPDAALAYGYTDQVAFRYDAATGVVTTSPLSSLWNVNEWSDDGRVAVGSPTTGTNQAMIRIDGQDQLVSAYLTNAGYDVSTLPTLNNAFGLTHDGTQFLAGNTGSAVLVTIPEPAAPALAAATLLLATRRARRRRARR